MALVRVKFRRGSAADWTSRNPILLSGEPGFESDTNKFKIGDGITSWTDLPYHLDADDTSALIATAIQDATFEGVPGPTGATGPAGDSAYVVAVDNGFVGNETAWLASLKGPKGDKGDTGNTGATGSQGIQGVKGDKGDTGDQGPQGIQGIQGIQGAQGATGSQGLKGDKGDQGDVGPQGIPGADGADGEPGIQGPAGDPGSPGADGVDGASAYEVAIANGFVGTESAWLLSLKGAKGDTGDTGPTGATGSAGATGATGATGPKGDPGDLNRVTVALTDGATIATDCSLGNKFRVTLGGNRTLSNPTNMTDGQSCIWEIVQDATGSRTLTFGSKFAFGTDLTAVTLTTTASKRDFLGAIYNSTADKWYVVAFMKGY